MKEKRSNLIKICLLIELHLALKNTFIITKYNLLTRTVNMTHSCKRSNSKWWDSSVRTLHINSTLDTIPRATKIEKTL